MDDFDMDNIGPILTPVGGGRMSTFRMQSPLEMLETPVIFDSVEEESKSKICVRGEPMVPESDVEENIGPFTLSLFRGFTGKVGEIVVGGRLLWRKTPDIPRDKVFVIHMFIDVSGSMCTPLWNGNKSRSTVICDAMRHMRDTLLPLVEKGLRVRLSLHTFSDHCQECIATTDATTEFLTDMNWDEYLRPTGLTNIWDCVKVAKEMQSVATSREVEEVYILMSDGEQTVEAEAIPEKVFDYVIGIGTSSEFDATVLRQISKHEIEACPDDTSLSASLLRFGCGSYMKLADNIKLTINNVTTEVKQWLSGTQLLTYCVIPANSNDISVTIEWNGTSHKETLSVTDVLPRRSTRSSRAVVDVCRLQKQTKEILTKATMREMKAMIRDLDILKQKFQSDSWAWMIVSGLYSTWMNVKDTMCLPSLDRHLSIQSAVRQTSANYYDVQMYKNCTVYSQKAS